MTEVNPMLERFSFGPTQDPEDVGTEVRILTGNILKPGVEVAAVVSSDDNYLTMASGVSELLRRHTLADPLLGGDETYILEAQQHCPVEAGTVIPTDAYGLKDHLGVDKVLHGTVIDYDSEMEYQHKEELVKRTTANCLQMAENLGLRSILFPAFATGSAGLKMAHCARAMCQAIKSYLALDRPLRAIYIVIWEGNPDEDDYPSVQEGNRAFIREANCVLGVPYDPEHDGRQIRDFIERTEEMKVLQDIITGKRDQGGNKRHAVILGGPYAGKRLLLDQLYHLSRQKGHKLGDGPRLVRLTFGGVHQNTPKSFAYRKFLCALAQDARGTELEGQIRKEEYADLGRANCKYFMDFLKRHEDVYPEVVFLVNKLPRLLEMENADGDDKKESIRYFWEDLDELQERVRFIYTARYEDWEKLKAERLEDQTEEFVKQIDPVEVRCVTEEERQKWINDLFKRYLGSGDEGAPAWAKAFLDREAGRHAYLLALAGHALVDRLKPMVLDNPEIDLDQLERQTRLSVCDEVLSKLDQPRRSFFAEAVNYLREQELWGSDYRPELEALAKAQAIEQDRDSLMPALMRGDPNVAAEWQELAGDPRQPLHQPMLDELGKRGLLVDTETRRGASFITQSFAAYVMTTLVGRVGPSDQPEAVTISILAQEPDRIRTVFRGRGARVVMSDKRLPDKDRLNFMQSFRDYVDMRFREPGEPEPDDPIFGDIEEVSNYILTQFGSVAVKRYLQNAPHRSTVLFVIDEACAGVPWELMLEAVYAGEIPFRVGRTVVSQQAPYYIRPPVRGISKIRPLLIGNPQEDLSGAADEVEELDRLFRRHTDFFLEPGVFLGPERCHSIRLLNALSSGQFNLVHYSGHARYQGADSAWQASDGPIRTDQLTNAIQMAPPPLVFASACESAEGGEMGEREFEGQSFDLPGAFLQAGVEVYIGALWRVDATNARLFARAFYEDLVTRKYELGECLRRAKWVRKQAEEAKGQIDWLSFVLYGDPRLTPGDLYPPMGDRDQSAY